MPNSTVSTGREERKGAKVMEVELMRYSCRLVLLWVPDTLLIDLNRRLYCTNAHWHQSSLELSMHTAR